MLLFCIYKPLEERNSSELYYYLFQNKRKYALSSTQKTEQFHLNFSWEESFKSKNKPLTYRAGGTVFLKEEFCVS